MKINWKDQLTLVLIAGIFFIIVTWFSTLIYFRHTTYSYRASWGDMFGGINALYTGLAFLGLIVTILFQRKDLQLQREELSLTREELRRSAKAQEESQAALNEQVQHMRISSEIQARAALANLYQPVDERVRKNLLKDHIGSAAERMYIDQIRSLTRTIHTLRGNDDEPSDLYILAKLNLEYSINHHDLIYKILQQGLQNEDLIRIVHIRDDKVHISTLNSLAFDPTFSDFKKLGKHVASDFLYFEKHGEILKITFDHNRLSHLYKEINIWLLRGFGYPNDFKLPIDYVKPDYPVEDIGLYDLSH